MTNRPAEKIAVIEIDERYINITASGHALDRMEQYEIDKYVVSGNVLALGPERIAELQQQREEAIIIDEVANISVVIGFSMKTVTIITVINKSNVFVKNNTKICKIQ